MSFKFSEFLKKKPIKRPGIVAVVGDFDPPAIGHETVFNEARYLLFDRINIFLRDAFGRATDPKIDDYYFKRVYF